MNDIIFQVKAVEQISRPQTDKKDMYLSTMYNYYVLKNTSLVNRSVG